MRQKNWKGHSVQLNASPEGCPIDPKILSETAVIALRRSQIDERSERCFHIAGRQQTASALNEIARPNEMIAAFSLQVSFSLSTGNGQRRHHRAWKRLVLVGQQQRIADAKQVAAIARLIF